MSVPFSNERLRRPTVGFTDLLRKAIGGGIRGRDEYASFMFRALVIASDMAGGHLETPDGKPADGKTLVQQVSDGTQVVARYNISPTRGPLNPKNSVRARIVANNMDQFVDDDSLRTFWPLFPGVDNPSAGEMVYVVFEDEEMVHGLWVAKVPTSSNNDSTNQILMSKVLMEARASKHVLFPDNLVDSSGAVRDASPVRPTGNRLTALFIDTGKPAGVSP
jgi:hypothetical protein